ncbi:MFS transporter [Jongsikchunia kroppenstedtii]|uniref:MFS transporter n=1 Tax=Jongsikchunia kroppenstedtii TaxID=1121721 RepID=UPI0009DA5AE4|nr:MFS transporter [Jongsikchunia kroppenstedtii]
MRAIDKTAGNLALVAACCAVFVGFLDTTITNLAVPSVASEFDVGAGTATWLATSYVIPFAALLAPAGALADAVGRARLFLVGVAVFTLCSLLIAVAPTFGLVLGARAAQGVGAALMTPASLALILGTVAIERRRAAIGLWSASGALAAAVGPALGGLVVEVSDWRVLFCLNVPIGLWALAAARRLRAADSESRRWPDLLGGMLLAVAIGSLVYAVTEGPEKGWDSAQIIAFFGLSGTALAAALWRSRVHRLPALRLDLLRNRSFAVAAGLSAAYGMSLFTTMLLGVMFLVNVWGYSTLAAGFAMTPAALMTAVVGVGVSRLGATIPPRRMIAIGGVVLAAVIALLAALVSSTAQLWALWLPAGIVMGIGVGLITVGISTVGTLAAPPSDFAAATGLLMAARQVGGALGIAILAAMLSEVTATTAERPYAAIYWFAAAVTALVAVGALLLRAAPPISPGAESSTKVVANQGSER